jgi:multiple sugar transport system permease protein
LGTPAAYALARFEFRGKTDLWFWFITNRFVSPVVLAFPVFLISRELGPARHASGADPDVSDLHPAHRDLDLHRPVPVDPLRTGRGGDAGRGQPVAHLPVDLPAAGDAGGGGQSILSFIFSWNELLFAYILAPKAPRPPPRWR